MGLTPQPSHSVYLDPGLSVGIPGYRWLRPVETSFSGAGGPWAQCTRGLLCPGSQPRNDHLWTSKGISATTGSLLSPHLAGRGTEPRS
eukprot:scaffold8901_cov31-Prasinocladus_malaysianus.AAC.2